MAFSVACMRKINLVLHPIVCPFYFFSGMLAFSVMLMIYDFDYIPSFGTYTLFEILLLVAGAVLSFGSQICGSLSYKYEKAARLQPYD